MIQIIYQEFNYFLNQKMFWLQEPKFMDRIKIGWGYGPKGIIKKLYEIKPPFNVSEPALFAATQAIQDTKWLNKAINHNSFGQKKYMRL